MKWLPAWGQERISNMIATRPDWCISRQRVWGVPIIVFYCEKCGEPLTDRKMLDRVVELFARAHRRRLVRAHGRGAGRPGREVRAAAAAAEFRKETDILDVWFDSGSSHLAVLTRSQRPALAGRPVRRRRRPVPRLVPQLAAGRRGHARARAPYRQCATHGWTLDEQGRAMSKSLGNVIEPQELIKQYGADVLRLWVASVEFTDDIVISATILTRLSEAYRKLRNTFRYALGNL